MATFVFSCAADLQQGVRYLSEFDTILKCTLSYADSSSSLLLTTARVPPFVFTKIHFDNGTTDGHSLDAPPGADVCWSVNGTYLFRLLQCFDAEGSLTMEFAEANSTLLFYQSREDGCLRVNQMCVVDDPNPSLSLHHGDADLYVISDVQGFKQMARSGSVYEESMCTLAVECAQDGKCYLVLQSELLRSSMYLGLLPSTEGKMRKGSLRSSDLSVFINSMLASKSTPLLLYIGFTNDGLTLLKLQWKRKDEERCAFIYFCAG
ncbi:hypothetical protein STCU_07378 [Strigomonas culicis]|uniref:Uncharacterized protein n=1 Tax=Strigomonas culicis TaxID=28005 RepID=S9TZK2_9TRYP|nr:hypothetical protein STCU_07378 [Strigomonas culicis]|eukprot:EPY23967.1 hypothetical protein STCU_07378 [Strigomonas culicis]